MSSITPGPWKCIPTPDSIYVAKNIIEFNHLVNTYHLYPPTYECWRDAWLTAVAKHLLTLIEKSEARAILRRIEGKEETE